MALKFFPRLSEECLYLLGMVISFGSRHSSDSHFFVKHLLDGTTSRDIYIMSHMVLSSPCTFFASSEEYLPTNIWCGI